MAKLSLPQKFPVWQSNHLTSYSGDIVKEKNVKISEFLNFGEIKPSNPLKLFAETELPTSIFKDNNTYLSFGTKNHLYYLSNYSDTSLSEYSPNQSGSSYYLDNDGTGVIIYPRGYYKISGYSSGGGSIGTANIDTFGDAFTRSYSFTQGQKVLGIRFVFNYAQSSGTNKVRFVVTIGSTDYVVGGDSAAVSGGYNWDYWITDGTPDLTASGFTAKIQVATDTSSHYVSWSSGGARIDFLLEYGSSQFILSSPSGILARYYGDYDKYYIFSTATSVTDSWNIYRGVDLLLDKYGTYCYPFVMKLFNEKLLIIGQGSYIYTLNSLYYYVSLVPSETDTRNVALRLYLGEWSLPYRLKLPNNYKVKWMDASTDTVYIGAVRYNPPFDETNDFTVFIWNPITDALESIKVPDGNCVGKVKNNYLYILTELGNIMMLINYQWKVLSKIYQTEDNYQIQLPHINGVVDYVGNKIAFLMPANKDNPAGIYIFDIDTSSVYHRNSICSGDSYDYGGDQPQVQVGALYYVNDNGEDTFYAGLANVIDTSGSFIAGVFKEDKSASNKIGYVEIPKIKSSEVDLFSSSIALKYKGEGYIDVAERKRETAESYYSVYSGTWNTATNADYFTMTSIPSEMSVGDRIIVLDGVMKGYVSIVKQIDTNNNRVYVDAPNTYHTLQNISVSGDFSFFLEKLGYPVAITDENKIEVSSDVAEQLSIGDEIEFTSGLNSGIITYITDIDNTTITLKDTIAYSEGATAKIKFSKYKYIGSITNSENINKYEILRGTTTPEFSDFSQIKVILKGEIRLNEIQINIQPNLTITEDIKF